MAGGTIQDGIPPMIDDVLALIDDAKLRCAIACLIESVLVAAVDANLAQRYAGHFLELPPHTTPINGPHNDGEVLVVGFLVKELREDFLGTLQAFRFAALPMQGCVEVVEALDAAPSKGTDFYGFAGHD